MPSLADTHLLDQYQVTLPCHQSWVNRKASTSSHLPTPETSALHGTWRPRANRCLASVSALGGELVWFCFGSTEPQHTYFVHMCFPLDSVLSWGPYLYSVVSRCLHTPAPSLVSSPGDVFWRCLQEEQASWVCLWGWHCPLGANVKKHHHSYSFSPGARIF